MKKLRKLVDFRKNSKLGGELPEIKNLTTMVKNYSKVDANIFNSYPILLSFFNFFPNILYPGGSHD